MSPTTKARPVFAAPLEETVPLRSGDLVVKSAVMGPLLEVKAKLLPALEQLAEEAPGIFDLARLDAMVATRMVTANDITDLCVLLARLDVAVEFVAILAPMPKAQVLELLPDEYAYLLVTVVQVNVDFFVQALPVFQAVAQRFGSLKLNGTSSSPTPSTP